MSVCVYDCVCFHIRLIHPIITFWNSIKLKPTQHSDNQLKICAYGLHAECMHRSVKILRLNVWHSGNNRSSKIHFIGSGLRKWEIVVLYTLCYNLRRYRHATTQNEWNSIWCGNVWMQTANWSSWAHDCVTVHICVFQIRLVK